MEIELLQNYPAELLAAATFVGPAIVQFIKKYWSLDSRYIYALVIGVMSLGYGLFMAFAPQQWFETIALVAAPAFGFGTALYNNVSNKGSNND